MYIYVYIHTHIYNQNMDVDIQIVSLDLTQEWCASAQGQNLAYHATSQKASTPVYNPHYVLLTFIS